MQITTSYAGVCQADSHQQPFRIFNPEKTKNILIRHCNSHHILPLGNRLSIWLYIHHLDGPTSTGIRTPPDSKYFVLVVHEYEFASRGAMSRALNLSTKTVIVAVVKRYESTVPTLAIL